MPTYAEQLTKLADFANFVIRDRSDHTFESYALKLGILIPDEQTEWGIRRSEWFGNLVGALEVGK